DSSVVLWQRKSPECPPVALMSRRRTRLERPVAEHEVDDVPFVWLQPVQLNRLHFADIQPVDVSGVQKFPLPRFVVRQCRTDQRGTDLLEHLFLWTFHNGNEWEHVFRVCQKW